jgi:wyosine [tRNA(Phe)-imidazoG37] synthetase (radical SAM superfamily)
VFIETEQLQAELATLPPGEAELATLPPGEADIVTFSGTGEPTLAANLGEALDLISEWPAFRGLPTAVLTNASLLSRPDVQRDLARADLVVAKLDAPDEALFQAVNRPLPGVTWAGVVEGIRAFRRRFDGKLALQMMFVAANRDRAAEMAALARTLDSDEVQLNTPLRPSPTPPLERAEMAEIELAFRGLPVVNVYTAPPVSTKPLDAAETRRRRPVEGHRSTWTDKDPDAVESVRAVE